MKPYKLAKGEEKYWLKKAKKVQQDLDNKRADVIYLKRFRDVARQIANGGERQDEDDRTS